MSDHQIRIVFDGWHPSYGIVCNAGPESFCHADFDCDCTEYYDLKVIDGKPVHVVTTYLDEEPWETEEQHVGKFNPDECLHESYLDALDAECIKGEITIDVEPEWDDGYSYKVIGH